jgi:hypothetical protein
MEERTLWFETWHEATHYAHKWGLDQKPELREAWVHYARRQGWSLRVPADWEMPLRNNAPGNVSDRANTRKNKNAPG